MIRAFLPVLSTKEPHDVTLSINQKSGRMEGRNLLVKSFEQGVIVVLSFQNSSFLLAGAQLSAPVLDNR